MRKSRFNQLLVFFVIAVALLSVFVSYDSLPAFTSSAIHDGGEEEESDEEEDVEERDQTDLLNLLSGREAEPEPDPAQQQTDQKINAVKQDVTSLKNKMTAVTQKITTLESNYNKLNQEISRLNANIRSTGTDQNQLKNELSTGLAGLQDDINLTQTDLEGVKEGLEEEKSSTSFIKLGLFIVIVLIVGLAIFVYMGKGRRKKGGSRSKRGKSGSADEILNYITDHIKKGWKFPHIKESLLRAGWSESDINQAYQETTKQNYQSYLQRKSGKKEVGHRPLHAHRNKIVVMTVVSIVVVVGLLFLLKGITAGKAIYVQESFRHDEIFECTPPHIVSGEGGCCLDNDNNTICDDLEAYEADRAEVSAEVCDDHVDCVAGEVCIDNTCGVIHDHYDSDCRTTEQCNINNIEVFTSDGETYQINGRQGSYTAAGAIGWTNIPLPNYCGCRANNFEAVPIAIEIIKNGFVCYDANGEEVDCDSNTVVSRRVLALSKEIILLEPGETSEEITHPNEAVNARLDGFTLTNVEYTHFELGTGWSEEVR